MLIGSRATGLASNVNKGSDENHLNLDVDSINRRPSMVNIDGGCWPRKVQLYQIIPLALSDIIQNNHGANPSVEYLSGQNYS